jgi:hypothetical protein
MTASLYAGQALPSHSLPRGLRVAPLPVGEGGGIWVHAPRALCADPRNEFHLHERDLELSGTRFVAELQADQAPCEWRFNDLAEGDYEALIQVASTGRTLARGVGRIIRGEIAIVNLEPLEFRVQGFVTSNGRPRPDLTLRFQPDGPVTMPEAPTAIRADGWYETLLGDLSRGEYSHKYCAWISAKAAANHVVKCGALAPRWDFDIAPGGIQVTVPPFSSISEWAHVRLQTIRAHPSGDGLVREGGSATFKPGEGFRREYIALPYGEFRVALSVGQPGGPAMSTVTVTLSERDPVVQVTLNPLNKLP